MEKVNGMPVYWLAHSLGQLLYGFNLPQSTLSSVAESAKMAISNLNYFIGNVAGLPLSADAAKEMLYNLEAMGRADFQSEEVLKPLTDQQKSSFLVPLWNFQAILQRELAQANIFYVTPHRAYDMSMLINTGENLLSPITLRLLGDSREEVVNDIREAARCLAFASSTAVGFHLYRALEAVIVRDYFPTLGVPTAEAEKNPNLGAYIKLLVNKEVDAKITAMLRHIKDHYRNPIMHPDEFWDMDKANGAMGLAISIIDVMVQAIEETRAGASS